MSFELQRTHASQAFHLDGHPISAKHVKRLHPRRDTVYRVELEPGSFRHTIPPTVTSVVVKQQKHGWEKEFLLEKEAYERLNELQGIFIPQLYGQGSFDGIPALILSDVEGITLYDHARNIPNFQDETLNILESHLTEALKKFYDHGAEYWDQKLDNFLFCDNEDFASNKVRVVDLEQIQFPNNIGSWETNVNLGGVGSLMSDLKDIRDRNREPSPICFWKTTLNDERPLRTNCQGGLKQSMNSGGTKELNSIVPSVDASKKEFIQPITKRTTRKRKIGASMVRGNQQKKRIRSFLTRCTPFLPNRFGSSEKDHTR